MRTDALSLALYNVHGREGGSEAWRGEEKFSKRDAVFMKTLLLEFIQFKHKVEGKELKKMKKNGIYLMRQHTSAEKGEGYIGEG